jgi:hypothetical protein
MSYLSPIPPLSLPASRPGREFGQFRLAPFNQNSHDFASSDHFLHHLLEPSDSIATENILVHRQGGRT